MPTSLVSLAFDSNMVLANQPWHAQGTTGGPSRLHPCGGPCLDLGCPSVWLELRPWPWQRSATMARTRKPWRCQCRQQRWRQCCLAHFTAPSAFDASSCETKPLRVQGFPALGFNSTMCSWSSVCLSFGLLWLADAELACFRDTF